MPGQGPAFNPYAPPQTTAGGAYAPGPIRGEGSTIRFSRHTFLPSICVKCGAREPTRIQRRMKQLVFVPWYGRMFGLIGYYATRRTAAVDLPICEACDAAYRRAVTTMRWTAALPVACLGLIFLGGSANVELFVAGGALGFLGSLLLLLVVYFAVAHRRMLPMATRIEDDEVTLGRVHPDATLAMVAVSLNAPSGPFDAARWRGPI